MEEERTAAPDLRRRLLDAALTAGCCTCDPRPKTFQPQSHGEGCRYRAVMDAADALASARYAEPAPGTSVLLAVLHVADGTHGDRYRLRVSRGANAALVLDLSNGYVPLGLSTIGDAPFAFCPGGDAETVDAVEEWAAAWASRGGRGGSVATERGPSAVRPWKPSP